MAYTADDLTKALKETWSREPVFAKAFDMEIQGSLSDLQRQRKGKPSYRQRQKNGRAGRK